MFRHRLAPEADYYSLPEPPAPAPSPSGFMLFPVAVIPGCTSEQWVGLQNLYVQAFELAVAMNRPGLSDRDLFAFWN